MKNALYVIAYVINHAFFSTGIHIFQKDTFDYSLRAYVDRQN